MITDLAHPWLKKLRQLQKRSVRTQKRIFAGEGSRLLHEAMQTLPKGEALHSIHFVIHVPEWAEKAEAKEMLAEIKKQNIPCDTISTRFFANHSATESPQGVLFVGQLVDLSFSTWIPKSGDVILVADSVQDPGNVGTMIRSAFASGCAAFFATRGTVDLYNPKVVRSSAGAIFHLPTFTELGFSEIASMADKSGLPLFVAQTESGQSWDEIAWGAGGVIVIGNEGAGASPFWKKVDSVPVRIPMREDAESINAAMAATIICFTATRKKN